MFLTTGVPAGLVVDAEAIAFAPIVAPVSPALERDPSASPVLALVDRLGSTDAATLGAADDVATLGVTGGARAAAAARGVAAACARSAAAARAMGCIHLAGVDRAGPALISI